MPERVAKVLAEYANEVRKLAYSLPDGVGENDALRLSEQMAHDAELWLDPSPAARTSLPSPSISSRQGRFLGSEG
jgi:hypothetical protein